MTENEKTRESIAEQETINKILENRRFEKSNDIYGLTEGTFEEKMLLKHGSKELKLYIKQESKEHPLTFSTFVSNVSDQKYKEETRILYKAAKQAMQAKVNEMSKPIKYSMNVEIDHPTMFKWAQNVAGEIFKWKEEEISKDGIDCDFTVTFYPEKNKVT